MMNIWASIYSGYWKKKKKKQKGKKKKCCTNHAVWMCWVITWVWRAAGCEWAHNDPHRKCERPYHEVFTAAKAGHRHHVASLKDTHICDRAPKKSCLQRQVAGLLDTLDTGIKISKESNPNEKRHNREVKKKWGSRSIQGKRIWQKWAWAYKWSDGAWLRACIKNALRLFAVVFFGFVNITALCCLDSELITMTVISVKSNRKLWIYVN